MRKLSLFVAVLMGGTLWAAGAAWADVAPRDACTSPGQPCQVAGPTFDQPGTCQTTTCTRVLPDGDGGMMTTTYACNRCFGGGGAGGNLGTGGAGGYGGGGNGGGGAAGAGGVGGGAAGAGGNATGGSGGDATGGAAGGSAGAGGSSTATGGAAGGAGGQMGPGPKKEPSKSGCAVAGGGAGLDVTALLLLGLIFLRRRPTRG